MYNHFEYCENIARKLKLIGHSEKNIRFFRATEQEELEDLEKRMSVTEGTLLIAIDGSQSTFNWNFSDSLMERPSYKIAIVKQTLTGNSQSMFDAQKDCKQIGHEIIARMMKDYDDKGNGMDLLEISSFEMRGFGPIKNRYYGVLIGYSFDRGINYEINPELWD